VIDDGIRGDVLAVLLYLLFDERKNRTS